MIQLVGILHQAGKIHNLHRGGVFGFVLQRRDLFSRVALQMSWCGSDEQTDHEVFSIHCKVGVNLTCYTILAQMKIGLTDRELCNYKNTS